MKALLYILLVVTLYDLTLRGRVIQRVPRISLSPLEREGAQTVGEPES